RDRAGQLTPELSPSPRTPDPFACSVRAGVHREVRRHREVAALTPEHRPPQLPGLRGEQVAGLGGDHVPAALGELALELARSPTGVAGEDPHDLHALSDLGRGA